MNNVGVVEGMVGMFAVGIAYVAEPTSSIFLDADKILGDGIRMFVIYWISKKQIY